MTKHAGIKEIKMNNSQKIWSGPEKKILYDSDCSIGSVIYENMKNYPNNICQISDIDDYNMTNEEGLKFAIRIAQHYKKMGLRHDDVIGLSASNSTYLMPVAVACLLHCTPFNTVNAIDENTLSSVYGRTKPKIIFCDGEHYEKIHRVTETWSPEIYTLTQHTEGLPSVLDLLEPTETEADYIPESLTLGGDQTAAILCSSGTTGMPKAVCISNRKLFLDSCAVNSNDVIFSFSALDWYSGVMMLILCGTKSCKRIIAQKPYEPEYLWQLVQKHKITYLFIGVYQANTLCKFTEIGLPSVRLLTVAGAAIAKNSLESLQKLMPNVTINFGYGMTEAGGFVSKNFGLDRPTSVGRLMPGMRARIVDEAGNDLGTNEVGEVLVHDGIKWNGYYGEPTKTQETQDALGWLHSGDLGYFDEEQYLYIVDRKKDIMKYKGFQYWPGEIEKTIAEMPDVVNVCVISNKDDSENDAAGALVVKCDGSALQAADIVEYVKRKLVVLHKQLNGGVVFVNDLPKNVNGKILKNKAKEIFMAAKTEH